MVKLILPGQVVPSTPVDAGLQRFLPVEVVREQEVAAAVARGAPVEKHDFDGADPNDLIELTYDDGFTQWISVEQFLADRREEGAQRQARGESEPASAAEVPIYPIFSERSRDLKQTALRTLRILRLLEVTDSPATMGGKISGAVAALAAVRVLESKLDPKPGLYRLGDPLRFAETTAPEELSGEPVLLFLHGTASNLSGSFGELMSSADWAPLLAQYDGRVFGWQHFTLSQSPIENALELVTKLPAGARLHLVSHSRGGIVGELLCLGSLGTEDFETFERVAKREGSWNAERQEQLRSLRKLGSELTKRQLHIERFVRVACPARGTLLASRRLDRYLSLILNAMSLVPGFAGNPVYDFTRALLLTLASRRTDPAEIPGLEAQMPESPLIAFLNREGISSRADLGVIAGDMEGSYSQLGLAKRLSLLATDLFYRERHDLVVNTGAMYGGLARKEAYAYFEQGPSVNHFSYFASRPTRERLLSWLARKADEPIDTAFLPITLDDRAGREVRAISRAAADPNAPVVFVLPGIMGSHLKVGDHRVWLDFGRLGFEGLGVLHMGQSNVSADGVVASGYEEMCKFLGDNNRVETFAFDWRDSVNTQADELARKISKELESHKNPVRILAHSMGGLVARALIARHEGLWKKLIARGGRLVMLGTPNRGSYVIPRLLFRVDRTLKLLALLDIRNNRAELSRIIAGFRGVLEMLPDDPQEKYFDSTWWKPWNGQAAQPDAGELKRAFATRAALAGAIDVKNMVYVAGSAPQTPVGFRRREDGKIEWLVNSFGDGTVPYALGLLKDKTGADVPSYYVRALHGDLANFREAFEGIAELLDRGVTSRLSTDPPFSRDLGPNLIPDRVSISDDEPQNFPVPEELIASALGAARPRKKLAKAIPPLKVSVAHGDLRLTRFPVVVGHYAGDSIVSAERVLDEQLDCRLSERARLNLYPGRHGTVEIVLDLKGWPPGAVVTGLGEVGEITADKVRGAVTEAVLRYLLRRSDIVRSGAEPPPPGLSFLLIGTGGGNALRVAESVRAIVRGVLEANQALITDDRRPGALLSEIQIVELYESTAARALYALHSLDPDHPAGFEGDQLIKAERFLKDLGSGRLQPPLSEYEGGWWRRILVMRERDEKTGQPKRGMKFTILTDRARVEDRMVLTQEAFIRGFQEQGTRSTQFHPEHARMLFDLLIPDQLKERMRTDAEPLVYIVDADTAQYPWEMLARRSAQGPEMLATRFGVLRQFRTPSLDAPPSRSRMPKAIVIGDPVSEYPELPGAQAEAILVADLLKSNGYASAPLVRPTALEALTQLFDPDCRVLHVAAHGNYDSDKPDHSGIVLGTSQFFTTGEVSQLPVLPELVFINCCHLAHIDAPHLYSSEPAKFAASISQRFIERGVKAIIAAGWAVDDAAAKTFASKFYSQMLEGERFGEAVLAARQETHARHPGINTWAAYQCYGDPEFRLEREPAARSAVAGRKTHPRPEQIEFCSRSEFLFELRGLPGEASKSDKTGAKPEELIPRIEAVTAALPPEWRDGEMLTVLADAWAAVNRIGDAIECYRNAFDHWDGKAPLRAVEQFVNRVDRDTALKLDAPPEGVSSADRKKLEGDRRAALDLLMRLIKLGATSERLALLAGFHKRGAKLATKATKGAKKPGPRTGSRKRSAQLASVRSIVQSHLKEAYHAYDQSFELAKREKGAAALYQATARLTFGYLSTEIPTAELLVEADNLVAAARERARSATEFWDRVRVADLLLTRHLIGGGFPKQIEIIYSAYDDACHGGVKPGEFSSVTEHIEFLGAILPYMASNRDGGPLAKALDQLRTRLGKYR
jgi:CHAT domain-containing protein/pimeloyl-ACP methyl ester carboxylesterase